MKWSLILKNYVFTNNEIFPKNITTNTDDMNEFVHQLLRNNTVCNVITHQLKVCNVTFIDILESIKI